METNEEVVSSKLVTESERTVIEVVDVPVG